MINAYVYTYVYCVYKVRGTHQTVAMYVALHTCLTGIAYPTHTRTHRHTHTHTHTDTHTQTHTHTQPATQMAGFLLEM